MTRETRPFGTWPSPVTPEMVAGKSHRFGALQAENGNLYWSESRPEEGGRGVVMRLDAEGAKQDMLPPPWSARSRVHEYGGGEFLVSDGVLYFVEADSQDVYALGGNGEPERVTDTADMRFADMAHDRVRNRLIAVAERHTEGSHEPENLLVSIDLKSGSVTPLAEGADFYATPRVSPDGKHLCWLEWNLPDMPWERATLYVAELGSDGTLSEPVRIAGGGDSAVFQPGWLADGKLLFVWDNSGWGELYAWDGERTSQVTKRNAELMRPLWVFHLQSWCALGESEIAAAFIEEGEVKLARVGLDGEISACPSDWRSVDALAPYGDAFAVIGASDVSPPAVIALHEKSGSRVLHGAGETGLTPEDISTGRMLRFEGNGGPLYALFYPPANAAFEGSAGERPPAIILAHGGPTGMADRGLKLKTQFWTSRGFAVADLDYSGSAGYGRDYRKRLDGLWGVQDVKDVAALVDHLVGEGLADPGRMLISGGSAGGFTVLMALAKLDAFAAGACTYGVADLSQLQRITHKFESGYLYGLTGTTPDNCEEVFAERSPLHCAHEISSPVIFFQGLDDKVVPPPQSRDMARTLREGGVPVAYREFEGEGHGFRRAETIIEVLRSEYAFYAKILALDVDEDLPELEIDNRSG